MPPFGGSMRAICLAVAVFAAVLSARGHAAAELRLVVADVGDHRLSLENRPSEIQAELIGIVEGDAPLFDVVECTTLVERLLPRARATELNMEVIIAQYNLASLWLGDICPGTNTNAIAPNEARAWLDELSGLRRSRDGAAFLRSREMMAEFYLFGAPGYEPDYAAAREYIDAQPEPRFRLYAAYMAAHGLGAAADANQSLAQLRAASMAGDRDATALLAQAQELGLGAPIDEAAAFAAYRRLAEGISTPVWYRLGMMYRDGRGVAADPCQARFWLRQAATHAWSPVPAAEAAYGALAADQCAN